MSLTVEEVSLDDTATINKYDNFLDTHPDALVQQTSTWAQVVKDISPDSPLLLIAWDNGKIVGTIQLFLYRHPLGNVLYSNPHAGSMGSLAVHPSADGQFIAQKLLTKAEKIAERHNCITVTLTSNPFASRNLLDRVFSYDYALSSCIHYVALHEYFDCDGNVTVRDYNRRSNLSRNIRKGRDSDLSVIESTDPNRMDQWYKVHCKRLSDLGGTPLPYELFVNALDRAVPRNRASFLYVVDEKNQTVGGGLYIYNSRVVDILMMSSSISAMKQGSNYLLSDYALRWAYNNGLDYFNWQASNPPNGGIVRFKEQWGSLKAPFYYYTKITGDLAPLFEAGLDRVREAYRWHYVVPFAVLDGDDKPVFATGDSKAFLPT